MKEHYTEADLLETYYTQPGESMPVMMHLAQCGECAARYERLERKLREAAACAPERHTSFWTMQRAAIMNKVRRSHAPRHLSPVLRLAAAVLLGVVAGGTLVYQNERQQTAPAAAAAQQIQLEPVPVDPWESEELQEFGSVVEWETWIEGDQSS